MGNSRQLEVLVGLFVCLGVAAAFLLTFRVSNLTGNTSNAGTYQVTANFQNIGGLKPGASITMAGVRVGRVSSIGFDPELFEAVVTMDLSNDYDGIPRDSNASILTAGLLGEQYIGLEPGGDIDMLKEGSKIEFTQSALVLEKIIGQFLFSKASE